MEATFWRNFLEEDNRPWIKGLTTSVAKLCNHKGLSVVICVPPLTALRYAAIFKFLYYFSSERPMLSLRLDLEAEAAAADICGDA